MSAPSSRSTARTSPHHTAYGCASSIRGRSAPCAGVRASCAQFPRWQPAPHHTVAVLYRSGGQRPHAPTGRYRRCCDRRTRRRPVCRHVTHALRLARESAGYEPDYALVYSHQSSRLFNASLPVRNAVVRHTRQRRTLSLH